MSAPEKQVILVTGATGFIGSRALIPLQNRGFEVHAVARALPENPAPGVTWHASDLLAPGASRTLLEAVRPSHLLHLAWYAEHGKFWTSPANLDWLSATLSLLKDFAAVGGRRFVGAGTCAEYDWTSGDNPGLCDEAATPLRPATLYGAAKASAFLTGEAFAKTSGIEFAWGRIFHLFGAGEAPARIVPTLIRARVTGDIVECGSGDAAFDFLPVDSVADAFAQLCASDLQGPVNIGSGECRNLRDLSVLIADLARDIVGETRGEVRFGVREASGQNRILPVTDRIFSTGWRPGSIPDALRQAIRAQHG